MKMFKSMFLLVFLLAVFLFSFSFAAQGAPICMPGTLDAYIGLGSTGCQIGTTQFSDFASLEIPSAATQIDPSAVLVSPVNDLNGPGLEFVLNQTADAGEFFDVRFGYNVSNNTFSGITLFLTGPFATGDGVVTTIEEIWPGAPFDPFYINPASSTIIVFAIEGINDTFEQLTFPPVTSIGVIKDIGVDGGLTGTGTLLSATNQFTVSQPIPEPATILLVAAGLGYLGIYRRRRHIALRLLNQALSSRPGKED
jgi:hypothetical protein